MSELLSARVDQDFKKAVIAWAKLHGMDISTFIRTCIQEKMEAEAQFSLPEVMIGQISFLHQIVFTCYDWDRSEDLIKQEVEHLWAITQANNDSPL